MAHITLANETVPSTPSSGNTILFTETTLKKLCTLGDDGVVRLVQPLTNGTTTSQSISANTNTYVTGANLTIPPSLLRAGAIFKWVIHMNKNNSQTGTAGPSWTVTFGTNGTISDAAACTFTGVAPTTTIADDQIVMIDVICRSIGSSGVLEGIYVATHIGAAATQVTGLMNQPSDVKQNTSGAVNTTVASSIIGVGVNLGANTAGTIQHVSVVGFNL